MGIKFKYGFAKAGTDKVIGLGREPFKMILCMPFFHVILYSHKFNSCTLEDCTKYVVRLTHKKEK